MRYSAVWPAYEAMWDKMVVTPKLRPSFDQLATYAIAHKVEYQEVERATGIPWSMIAVIHRREGDGNFNTYLGNGQPLHQVTTIVPKGRGPFPNFLVGAVDALRADQLTSVIDWRLEKQLYWLTAFNGWGYGTNSPYIWAGTNLQKPGKYTSDDHFDPHAWDTQPGCAPLLAEIARLDSSVKFVRETAPGKDVQTAPVPPTDPTSTPPAPPQSTAGTVDWAGQIDSILQQMKTHAVPPPTPKNPIVVAHPVHKTPGPTIADTKLCISIVEASMESYALEYVNQNYPFAAGMASGPIKQLAGGAATAIVDALISRGKII